MSERPKVLAVPKTYQGEGGEAKPKRIPVPGTNRMLGVEGAVVERSSYWLRRERDGDVELREVPADEDPKAAKANSDQAAKPAKNAKG